MSCYSCSELIVQIRSKRHRNIMMCSASTFKPIMMIVAVALTSLLLLIHSAMCYDRDAITGDPHWTITTTVALNGVKQSGSAVTCTCVPVANDERDKGGNLQSLDKTTAVAIPPGYQLYGGKWFYKLHETTASWPIANRICEEAGAHLVIIESEEEEEVIVELLRDIGGPNNTLIQVGFHDLVTEGEYQTVLGAPLEYANWVEGEPRDTFGLMDCGAADLSGQLVSAFCYADRPFVCELPV